MRFLWQSNAPWAGTGYGAQTKLMLEALKGLGHDPECFPFYGLQGGRITYDGYQCWPPSPFSDYGADVVQGHINHSGAEALVTLMDVFVLDESVYSKLNVPWIAWLPVDSEEVGRQTINFLDHIDVRVAMSRFGAYEMQEAGYPAHHIIYHAVDTEVFKPMDKRVCRAELGIDDECYLIGMVMANKGDRKQYPAQFAAIRKWIDEHPHGEKVHVFIHTEKSSRMGGWEMTDLAIHHGLKGQIHATDSYFTSVVPVDTDLMAKIYNSFDVLMNCSAGEGFGIPIIEAQACGVPVITHGVTAMPEITVNGYCVEPMARIPMAHFGYQYIPNTEDMVAKLEAVYRMADKERAEMGRQWVIENCSLPVIAKQWSDVLDEVANPEAIVSEYIDTPLPAIDDDVLKRLEQDGVGQGAPEAVLSRS